VLGDAAPPGYIMHALDEQLHITSVEEPALVVQTLRETAWKKAMEDELRAIE
jgi:hypothetical protein